MGGRVGDLSEMMVVEVVGLPANNHCVVFERGEVGVESFAEG